MNKEISHMHKYEDNLLDYSVRPNFSKYTCQPSYQ